MKGVEFMVRTSSILQYLALVAACSASCLVVLPHTPAVRAEPFSAVQDDAEGVQDVKESSADLSEFLDRMRSFGRGGIFGRGRADRHVQDAAGQITELRLSEVELQPGDAKLIADLAQLEKLDLRESNVSDEDMRLFESLASLKELSLRRTDVSGIAMANIGRMQGLTRLDISRTKISDQDLRHLQRLMNLTHVILDDTPVTDGGLDVLSAMPQLERLSLGNTKITDAGLRHLRNLPRLRGLTLDETKVTEKGLQQIARLPGFSWIATPNATVNEYVQRIELGQFDAAREMFVAGVTIPARGNYRLLSLEAVEQSQKDRQRGRRRFKAQFHWTDRAKKTDEILSASFRIDRGAVMVMEVSIDEYN